MRPDKGAEDFAGHCIKPKSEDGVPFLFTTRYMVHTNDIDGDKSMATQRQSIQIGESEERIGRVVRRRQTRVTLGIETGFIEHRRQDVPVWRPINPVGLGLRKSSWVGGIWRNIYRSSTKGLPTSSDPERGLVEHKVAGNPVPLPGLTLELTPSLVRFLEQHLR